MNRIVCTVTAVLSSTAAIILVPIACIILRRILPDTMLTLVLSIAALTITQLVLRSGDQDTKAIQTKLDALIRVSDAPDELAGIERKER